MKHALMILLFACHSQLMAQTIVEQKKTSLFELNDNGKLVYKQSPKGERLPDFSHVGYHSGEKTIPDVPVKRTLEPAEGDDTERIQQAINDMGRLEPDGDGFRGTLLLKRGTYRVDGTLRITESGIVLRGEGSGPDGTLIIATGYGKPKYKRTLITVGNNSKIQVIDDSKREITDPYVPVGTHSFSVESVNGYNVGDRIALHRPATAKWISAIGCDKLKSKWETKDGKKVDATQQWTPNDYGFYFERVITAIEEKTVTIDAPVMHAMDSKFGGGAIYHYRTKGRVTEVGIENLRIFSEFAAPRPKHPYGAPKDTGKAEAHGWNAIRLSLNTENLWVRNVTGHYFGWSVVSAMGKRATVQDCVSLGHASKITGGRRYPFMISGQMNLMQRCVTFAGRHEFVTQARTAGPNVFVDCVGFDSKSSAGPHHRYSIGTLFDNVKSQRGMESRFRGNSGTGHGWAGTQTCFYNCTAPGFAVKAPPGGISWVIGSGKNMDARVAPASLYYQQVQDRLGKEGVDRLATEKQRQNLGTYQWAKERLKDKKKKR